MDVSVVEMEMLTPVTKITKRVPVLQVLPLPMVPYLAKGSLQTTIPIGVLLPVEVETNVGEVLLIAEELVNSLEIAPTEVFADVVGSKRIYNVQAMVYAFIHFNDVQIANLTVEVVMLGTKEERYNRNCNKHKT